MKNVALLQSDIQRRDRAPLITKIALVLLFVLGMGVILMGYTGMQEYGASGFSSEEAYRAVYSLSRETDSAWSKSLQPQIEKLPADQAAAVYDIARQLVTSVWESQKTGAGEDAQALLDSVRNDGERNPLWAR